MSAAGAVAPSGLSPDGCEMYHAAASDQSGASGIKVSVPPLLVRQDDTVSAADRTAETESAVSSRAVDLLCAEENIGTLDEEDVLRDTGGVDAVEVGLEGGGDAAVLLAELGGELDVTVALGGQDEVGPGVDGVLGLGVVDDIEAVGVAGKCSLLLHEVEAHHVGLAVGGCGSEAYRTEYAGDVGSDGVLYCDAGNLPRCPCR